MAPNSQSDWRTIRIPASDFERHNRNRKNLGVTWAEYIDGEAPEYTYTRSVETVSRDELREIVRQEIRDALRDLIH